MPSLKSDNSSMPCPIFPAATPQPTTKPPTGSKTRPCQDDLRTMPRSIRQRQVVKLPATQHLRPSGIQIAITLFPGILYWNTTPRTGANIKQYSDAESSEVDLHEGYCWKKSLRAKIERSTGRQNLKFLMADVAAGRKRNIARQRRGCCQISGVSP